MAQLQGFAKPTAREADDLVTTNINTPGMKLSRISKLLVDGSEVTTDEALARRQKFAISIRCGADVRQSRTLQLAVLTAANIANRCFPGAITVQLEAGLADAPLLLWRNTEFSFGRALMELLGAEAVTDFPNPDSRILLFGNVAATPGALRATFDGWIARVGPATTVDPLPHRQYCGLSGVLAGALAISELFLSFAQLSVEAGHRTVGLSLWRPDLEISDPAALGVNVKFLPRDMWVLGLGHLGNAYLWALAALPYAQSPAPEVFLNDFDRIERENVETGMIFGLADQGMHKTRVCSKWLETRGFRTRIIERRFDSKFRCRTTNPDAEPRLALCGFDSNPARRDLETAGFTRVLESGLGGTKDNFDTISFHALPNPRAAKELWPDLTPEEETKHREQREHLARENRGYAGLASDDCGRAELAGKSVAVPFVGAVASTLVLAEAIRLLHGGQAYTDIKLGLSDLNRRFAATARTYGAEDLIGMEYSDAALDR